MCCGDIRVAETILVPLYSKGQILVPCGHIREGWTRHYLEGLNDVLFFFSSVTVLVGKQWTLAI